MKTIYYKLIDIELWFYDGKNFPKLLPNEVFSDHIDNKFTKHQFNKIEVDIKNDLKKSGYLVYSIMNPLYLDSQTTVISVDIIHNKHTVNKLKSNPPIKIEENLEILLKKHQKRLDEIFSHGDGSLERFRKNGILFSKDKQLYDLEIQISQISTDNISQITKALLNSNSLTWLQSLQWTEKSQNMINVYLEKLKNSNEQEINIILLQLIPLIDNSSNSFKKHLTDIILNNLLIFPSSTVRNKAMSILSEIPKYTPNNRYFIDFIKTQANSKQLNCSYPAKEILGALNSGCQEPHEVDA
ncbi:hypothetical protein C4566_03360 [Candidatus Parcubacteria bacterium]|nr:MAG: hypothetical protein C4566_03360 [Candidatus Parcubacteria bacterium]